MVNKKVILGLATVCSLLNASGYKVPEQSADSVALLASNVAMSFGADAAYYNPANMMFLDHSGHYVEGTLGWFHIDSVGYKKDDGSVYNSNNFDTLASTFSFVSPEYYENWRFGLALAVPAGVGIGWDDKEAAFSAHRFKLKVIELNPTIAYRVSDNFAIAAGARAVYSKGRVANDYGIVGKRELEGDSIDYGYNVALTYRPIENLSLAATYRSKVDLSIKGDATGTFIDPRANYSGAANVEIPLPAQLVLAAGYKFNDLTLLLAYERTYWSKFKGYDFDYPNATNAQLTNPLFVGFMDKATNRKYQDTSTYRVGLAYEVTDKLRLMLGFTYDEDASYDSYNTSLDLPNTKSRAYSTGLNYQISPNLEIALGYLYQRRDAKRATSVPSGYARSVQTMNGEFDRASIQIVATSIKYKF
nr:outer membrane protein transport protein [Campylobacter anatolicus]